MAARCRKLGEMGGVRRQTANAPVSSRATQPHLAPRRRSGGRVPLLLSRWSAGSKRAGATSTCPRQAPWPRGRRARDATPPRAPWHRRPHAAAHKSAVVAPAVLPGRTAIASGRCLALRAVAAGDAQAAAGMQLRLAASHTRNRRPRLACPRTAGSRLTSLQHLPPFRRALALRRCNGAMRRITVHGCFRGQLPSWRPLSSAVGLSRLHAPRPSGLKTLLLLAAALGSCISASASPPRCALAH